MDPEIKELADKYRKYAKEKGVRLNPDEQITEGVIKGVLRNEKKYGEKYCPCRRVEGDPEIDKKIICPCRYSQKEIQETGHCHCYLFVK